MTWKPNGTVTINNTAYTNQTLWNVQVSYGRSNVLDQSRAGYANVQLLSKDGTHFNIQLNDTLVIQVEDSSAADVTVFTGKVTDVRSDVNSSGAIGTTVITTVTALGPFGQMARNIIGESAYPKEYDDDRMDRILTEAGVPIEIVDTPGVYEFTARAADPTDAYTLATYYAQMGFGYVYETQAGEVGYANESRRRNEVDAYGYFTIPEDYILWSGVSSNRTLNDLVNSVILTYKANATRTATDATSIATFGTIASKVSTELENLSEAQTQANRYIALRATPQTNLSSFSVMLDSPNMSPGDIDIFLNMYMGKPIEILNLPNAVINTVYKGFVEGFVLSFNSVQANMTLTTTDSSLSIVPTRWQDVDPLDEWQDVDPTVQWFQYE
jgi:hypothetical protein